MSTTGRFRSDLIAAAGAAREPVPPPVVTPNTGAANPYGNWLDRVQRSRGRHAAITKNLYTWSSYKNWADRVKDSFEPKKDKSDKPR